MDGCASLRCCAIFRPSSREFAYTQFHSHRNCDETSPPLHTTSHVPGSWHWAISQVDSQFIPDRLTAHRDKQHCAARGCDAKRRQLSGAGLCARIAEKLALPFCSEVASAQPALHAPALTARPSDSSRSRCPSCVCPLLRYLRTARLHLSPSCMSTTATALDLA